MSRKHDEPRLRRHIVESIIESVDSGGYKNSFGGNGGKRQMKKYIGTAYKTMKEDSGVDIRPALAADFIEYYRSHLNISEKVLEQAKTYCEEIESNPVFSGISQIAVAAGAIHLATGEDWSPGEIGDVSNTSAETIKRHSERLVEEVESLEGD